MITTEFREIEISEVDAMELAAYYTPDAVYDPKESKLRFRVYITTEDSVRLVHDGTTAITILQGASSTTTTLYQTEEFETEQQAYDRIDELDLDDGGLMLSMSLNPLSKGK